MVLHRHVEDELRFVAFADESEGFVVRGFIVNVPTKRLGFGEVLGAQERVEAQLGVHAVPSPVLRLRWVHGCCLISEGVEVRG